VVILKVFPPVQRGSNIFAISPVNKSVRIRASLVQ
jgi:hypothetical protein